MSFALAEAELVWREIVEDAAGGELRPVYDAEGWWQPELEAPVVMPPGRRDLGRYVIPMLGLYPARGCPFTCNFCSVIKIAGRRIRSHSDSESDGSAHRMDPALMRRKTVFPWFFGKFEVANV